MERVKERWKVSSRILFFVRLVFCALLNQLIKVKMFSLFASFLPNSLEFFLIIHFQLVVVVGFFFFALLLNVHSFSLVNDRIFEWDVFFLQKLKKNRPITWWKANNKKTQFQMELECFIEIQNCLYYNWPTLSILNLVQFIKSIKQFPQ